MLIFFHILIILTYQVKLKLIKGNESDIIILGYLDPITLVMTFVILHFKIREFTW